LHTVQRLIKDVNHTHPRLGPLVAINVLSAKAKVCILNVAPAGCGKSTATDSVHEALPDRSVKYTSLTLASLHRRRKQFTDFDGHLVIDDLGGEKSLWSRTATVAVLANLVYTGFVHKITMSHDIKIENFRGSASLNVQPVLMYSLITGDEWIAVVRDKVLRYYHLIRPIKPKSSKPELTLDWGKDLSRVSMSKYRGKLFYQLLAVGLTQWSHARCLEHLPAYLKAAAALDGRTRVNVSDYYLLRKLLAPMQLERYLVESYGFESGRTFDNNLVCILAEMATHREPTVQTICEDFKISPTTVYRLVRTMEKWCFKKTNSPTRIMPTDACLEMLNICGVFRKW